MLILLFFTLICLAVSSRAVIKQLREKYPELYRSWGEPGFSLSPFNSGWGFIAGFAGMLGYRKENLDAETSRWCHLLAGSYWLWWLVCLGFVWVIHGSQAAFA